jgi:hypothetical protein
VERRSLKDNHFDELVIDQPADGALNVSFIVGLLIRITLGFSIK